MACTQSTIVHMIAGGVGGTSGAIITCPLDVLKTRQQSSIAAFNMQQIPTERNLIQNGCLRLSYSHASGNVGSPAVIQVKPGMLYCLRTIVQEEGVKGLFKGLGPHLIGVTPSRAIYFSVYAKMKRTLKSSNVVKKDSLFIPLFAGACAGFCSTTATCPVWVLKTRLQLNKRRDGSSLKDCVSKLYQTEGIRGFYRGLLISYVGIAETSVHFLLYEQMKAFLRPCGSDPDEKGKCFGDFAQFMFAASFSKIVSVTLMYPHEVVRTRLRQPVVDGVKKYKSVLQTLRCVAVEEGIQGLYGGLTTQIVRQIPNTAAMFVTYELVVSFFCS